MDCYVIGYVYRVLSCQIYVNGKMVANEIWNIFGWGEDLSIKKQQVVITNVKYIS